MRRGNPRRLVAAVSLVATASSCSLFADLGGLASELPSDAAAPASDAAVEGATSPDGRAEDAAVVVPDGATADAGDAGPVNLHPAGTFESGCGAWGGYMATLTPSNVAHTGSGSCRVCPAASSTDTFFTIDDQGASGPPVVGARYRARAWVRGADTGPSPSFSVINLRTAVFTPTFMSWDQAGGPNVPLSAAWVELSVELTITQAKGKLNVFIGAPKEANLGCFLVDDVRLERID